MASITIRYKDQDGHEIKDLEGERLVLGRSSDCDISLASERISRQHCVLIREGETWYVEDLGSANGTRVGNERIEQRRALGERDRIKLGNVRLTFHYRERRPDKGIDLSADELAGDGEGSVPTRERGADDPPEAMSCSRCTAWISIAHRLPGEAMDCPRCGQRNVVPQLVAAGET